MTKTDEAKLADAARTAKDLRDCVDHANSMILSWARHRKEAGEIYVSLADRRTTRWHTGVHLPSAVVEAELIPILKRIRENATAQLQALELPK